MPKLYTINGYCISIWSNENGEPIHIHVSKRRPSTNSTKIWLLKNGGVALAHNKSRIPSNEIHEIMESIAANYIEIVQAWQVYHGYIKFIG